MIRANLAQIKNPIPQKGGNYEKISTEYAGYVILLNRQCFVSGNCRF